MKQILQNLSNGETLLVDVPCPKNNRGHLLIETRNSVISAGTERMLVGFGKAGWIDKARQQPDKVQQVLNKVKTDGLLPTIEAVRSKLDQPLPLGYCNAGVVTESNVEGFAVGGRVASNGYHAEMASVPKNLCAKIPDGVDDESAAFTVLGAISLQGIRLMNPTLGESLVVFGLGLVGLMAVQMLRANGCHVLGIDFDAARCALASQFGAETVDLSKNEDPIEAANVFSHGRGVDAVFVAATTQSDEVMHQATIMLRKRGRIVLVGVVGLNLRRDDFFKKEITFQVSASYGPGRYDPLYEEKGIDYPVGFVRWTAQRNFEAVLDMMEAETLNVKPLITHRFKIDQAAEAYGLLDDPSALGIVLEYPIQETAELRRSVINLKKHTTSSDLQTAKTFKNSEVGLEPMLGFIGAGNHASQILIPTFKAAGAKLEMLVTRSGMSAVHHGNSTGFNIAATDLNMLWGHVAVNTVVIATRHDAHADQVVSAIKSEKNVFVEKPLALKLDELDIIDEAYRIANKEQPNRIRLMVGFNRRFAPHIVKMKSLLKIQREPKSILMTVNAGAIPTDHWIQDQHIGGGRIVGEACHFIDLMRFLVGHTITQHQVMAVGEAAGIDIRSDKVTINLSFEDGSFGAIHYLANGGKAFPKERIEVFCGNGVLQLDNYRILKGFNWPNFKQMKLFRQDKGHKICAEAFLDSVRYRKPAPIPYVELIETSRISIEIAEKLY